MTSNIETNGAANQLAICRQALEQVRDRYPEDAELIGTLEDMHEAARRFYGWLKFLQECQQRVKATYTQYVNSFSGE